MKQISDHCVTDGEHGSHWCPEEVSSNGMTLSDLCAGTPNFIDRYGTPKQQAIRAHARASAAAHLTNRPVR